MADKGKEEHALGGTAIKPAGWDRTGFEAFKYMIYNPDTGEVLTRTPISWAKIIAFYLVYYCFLAGFWIAALQIFFMTLPSVPNGPSWKLDNSLIGMNPGVGLRPKNSDKLIDSQMFVLKQGDESLVPSHKEGEGDTNADYAKRLENFLEVYGEEATGGYNSFDLSELGDYCKESPFGYVKTAKGDVAPCIVVKLNTIWDWTPVKVGSDYVVDEDTGETLPAELKTHIEDREAKGLDTDMVWINCEGRYAADKEALENMEYFPPSRGFPVKYFPYQGRGEYFKDTQQWEKRYHAPLVAIKITPKIVGQLIHIQCKAYYDGVVHVSKDKQGMVQFEVQVKTNI